MEYIRGLSLDAYLSDKNLSIAATLRLFRAICAAVNYAHQRGVIHRDLKPGNVRVDAEGQPHILDFGLAKVAGTDLTQGAPMTVTGEFMGTLAYASPEQTTGDPNLIDIRTDVYSLGVVLYEMLTGKYPYPVVGQMAEVLKNIAEAEPNKPSTIRRQINDEVETIVLRCLQKQRDRRYQSAGELARDIEHFLAGEPIEAKRDSGWYVIRKSLRRYRAAVAVAAAFVLMLAASTVALSIMYQNQSRASEEAEHARDAEAEQRRLAEAAERVASEQRRLAEIEARKAETSAAEVRAVVKLLKALISEMEPVALADQLDTSEVARLAERIVVTIDARFPDQPEHEAVLRYSLAVVCAHYNLWELAAAQASAALDIWKNVLGPDHEDTISSMAFTERCLNNLSVELREAGRLTEAEAAIREAIALAESVFGEADRRTQWARANLAAVLLRAGEFDQGERVALAIDREGWTGSPGFILHLLVELYEAWGKPEMAEHWRARIEKVKAITPPMELWRAAEQRLQRGDYAGAEELARQAVSAARELFGNEDPRVANALNGLALVLRDKGDLVAAERLLRECLEVRRNVLQEGDWVIDYTQSLLGGVLARLHRFELGESQLLEAYKAMKGKPVAPNHRKREALWRIADLYHAWHVAEPDKGYDAKAAEWRAKLPAASRPATQPTAVDSSAP